MRHVASILALLATAIWLVPSASARGGGGGGRGAVGLSGVGHATAGMARGFTPFSSELPLLNRSNRPGGAAPFATGPIVPPFSGTMVPPFTAAIATAPAGPQVWQRNGDVWSSVPASGTSGVWHFENGTWRSE